MKQITLIVLIVFVLDGCGLFGSGKDTNHLIIDNKGCTVELSQLGKVAGLEETTLVETVKVEPDCTVIISVTDELHPQMIQMGKVKDP
jgi:hypothetical protein